ncbi:MAG: ribosome hibernation-promoting factor, HPF/YfiA family [Verrucomicrobiota bacterium]
MKQHDVIISGLNLELTDAMKNVVHEKAEKLFEHEDHIIRMRVELQYDSHQTSHQREYIAKGHLEVRGNDHVVSVATDDMYKSIDQMVQKLDRMIRRRHRMHKVKRKNTHFVEIPAEIPKAS